MVSEPVMVMDGAADVWAGDDYTIAEKEDGTLWIWGYNRDGIMLLDPAADYLQAVPAELGLN
jgi:alpha-tubulin suppressor-like RCC1 family protein